MEWFSFGSYKDALRFQIKANYEVKGYKGKLAQAAGCQRAYLSQVLGSHVQLTPEHGLGLAEFWRLSALERDFFLELIHLERAGTQKLKIHLQQKIKVLRDQHQNLSLRFQRPGLQQAQSQATYYSSWQYAAIHILLTIPGIRRVGKIAQRLGLPEESVLDTLNELKEMGLVKSKGGAWETISFDLHVPQSSPMNAVNHGNWRQRAAADALRKAGQGVHFTAVYSLSEADMAELKSEVLALVSRSRERALASPPEKLVCFTCDFFEP